MSVESALLDLYESSVTVAPMATRRGDGKLTYAAAVAMQAHVDMSRHMVRTSAGEEVPAEGSAMLTTVYPWVDSNCKLTLPDGSTPAIITVDTLYGPNIETGVNGPYCTIIHFGR